MQLIYYTTLFPGNRPVRYYDNIVYRDIFSNIAIRYFLLDIAITAIEKCVLKVEAQAKIQVHVVLFKLTHVVS